VGGVLSLPATRSKINEILYLRGVYHPFTPRFIQWQCSFDILTENNAWIKGVGTGDVKPLLQSCYQDKKFWGHLYNYNLHNEYLEEMVRHGLIGLSVLFLAFFYPLITAARHRNYLYVYFILIFMLACVSESFLNRQKGVIIYAFFNALIFSQVNYNSKKNSELV
jgi:O-antigen ligase